MEAGIYRERRGDRDGNVCLFIAWRLFYAIDTVVMRRAVSAPRKLMTINQHRDQARSVASALLLANDISLTVISNTISLQRSQ